MRQRINLVTLSDVQRFIDAVSKVEEKVTLSDNDGHRVSAQSMLGLLYSLEWTDTFVECDRDIYMKIAEFVVNETPNDNTK